jgi:hypothetical protein
LQDLEKNFLGMLSDFIVDIPSNQKIEEFQKKRDSLGIWHSFLESTITKKGKNHNPKTIKHIKEKKYTNSSPSPAKKNSGPPILFHFSR